MKQKREKQSIRSWLWGSFIRTALLPFVLVAIGFVLIYFMTNAWSRNAMTSFTFNEVNQQMSQLISEKTNTIEKQLESVSVNVQILSKGYGEALKTENSLDASVLNRFAFTDEGTYYTTQDTPKGSVAVFYSGYYPIGEPEKIKVMKLLKTEALMKDIVSSQPLAAQVYLNTYDSLNIIFPYFDVIMQYAPLMNIPSYNFYYEADMEHNPDKKVVWTDAYLDPAGLGWMASAIIPVYSANEFLEGVAGIDITISTFTNEILSMDVPYEGYLMLVAKDGTILALPQAGESDWQIKELGEHHYDEAILKDTFKPENFNFYNIPEIESLAPIIDNNESGNGEVKLNGNLKFVSWHTINETGWKLLMIVPKDLVYSEATVINNQLIRIGWVITIILNILYAVLFTILSKNANKLSYEISSPLVQINEMVERIGNGEYYQTPPDTPVLELQDTANQLSLMGKALGDTNTQLMDIQRELKRNEADLNALLHSIDDMILEIDETGNLINQWNNTGLIQKSYFATSSIKNIDNKLKKKGSSLSSVLSQIESTGESATIEYSISTDVSIKWFLARISRVESDEKKYVISARDITHQKNLEFSLIEAKDLAENANRSKSQFLSNMSHELRTPLNAIIGFSQLLLMSDENELDDEQKENVGEIEHAGKHLLKLINEVLDLARIESGKMTISLEPVIVNEVMREAVTMIKPVSDLYHVQMETHFTEKASEWVVADQTRLKQVLINLVTNAIKYNKPNGLVKFYVELVESKVMFHIEDDGIGIPSEHHEAIFNPFYRLNMENNFFVEGTGIGLSVAKEMTELMKGSITLTSTPNEGSHFIVTLPRAELESDHMSYSQVIASKTIELDAIKVLYVEDNVANLKLMQRIIENMEGVTLIQTQFGEQAVALALAELPDVILLDLNLPDIDGFEVLKRIKKQESLSEIPTIALTAYAMPEDQAKVKLAGFDSFIPKPIEIEYFISELERLTK